MSAKGLARSVAHRLKYYIEVTRKEDSFDSSGVIRDEIESTSLYMKDNEKLEHDFAKIKLEADLRPYTGSAEECKRKVQRSAGRRKDLEKLIKTMAQDYVPDTTNEGRGRHLKRQKRSPASAARLCVAATPFMSPDEVRRLVSSASKLIVAATSKASQEDPESPCEGFLSPEGKDTKSIRHLGDASTPCAPFTRSHVEGAKAVQGDSEECVAETAKKHLGKNDRKKFNRTRKEKPAEDNSPIDISSEISRNPHKSEGAFSRSFRNPNNRDSLNAGYVTPYLQIGPKKVWPKGRLGGRTSSAPTRSVISHRRNKEITVQLTKRSPSQQNVESGCPSTPADGPIGEVASIGSSRSNRLLKIRPILSSGNPPGCDRKAPSAKLMAEAIRTESLAIPPRSSAVGLKSSHLKVQGSTPFSRLDQRRRLVRSSPSNRQKLDQGSKRDLEGQKVHFQKRPHTSTPGPNEWKHHSLDGWSVGELRGPASDQILPIVTESRCPELVKCLQEDQEKVPVPADPNGPSFLYQVCQEMNQEEPSSLTMNISPKSDGRERTSNRSNQLFLMNEAGGHQTTEDPAKATHKLCDQQTVSSPPVTLGSCGCSDPSNGGVSEISGAHRSGSPLITTAVLGRWGDELSEEEFTISSVSSASSLAGIKEQMNGNASVDLEEEDRDANVNTETLIQKILHMIREESATPQRMFGQPSGLPGGGKSSSPAEEERTSKVFKKGVCRIVYFSQQPTSI